MTAQLGIHVARECIRAVLVDNERVIATASNTRREDGGLAVHVSVALSSLPSRVRWRSTLVTVAVCSDVVTSKTIAGLPVVAKRSDLEQMVRQNAGRFFIGEVNGMIISAVACRDLVFAEAYDRAAATEVFDALRSAGARRVRIISAMSALEAVSAPLLKDASHLDEVFLCALGATRVAKHHVPGVSSDRGVSSRSRTPVWRSRCAIGAAIAAAAFLAASPFINLRRATAASNAEIAKLTRDAAAATTTWHGLNHLGSNLDAVARFQSSSRSATTTLAAVTHALPDDAALVAFAIDSSGGSLVTVSERAMDVLAALDTVPVVATPRLSGPITREATADLTLERAAIHFTWRRRK